MDRYGLSKTPGSKPAEVAILASIEGVILNGRHVMPPGIYFHRQERIHPRTGPLPGVHRPTVGARPDFVNSVEIAATL
jgi:hypothetical protein